MPPVPQSLLALQVTLVFIPIGSCSETLANMPHHGHTVEGGKGSFVMTRHRKKQRMSQSYGVLFFWASSSISHILFPQTSLNHPRENSPAERMCRAGGQGGGDARGECATGKLFFFFQRDTKLLVNKLGVKGLCGIRHLFLRDKGRWGRDFPRNYQAKKPWKIPERLCFRVQQQVLP